MAKRRRKTKTHLKGPDNTPNAAAPKSFVIRSGAVSRHVANLVGEVRHVMEPNTASRLRERKSNRLRDFLSMCGPLGVSHMVLFSQKGARDVKRTLAASSGSSKARRHAAEEAIGNVNLRIARAPRGPTVTFRVNKFALAKDIARAQRRAHAPGGEYRTPPLLVLNNFGSQERHIKLLVSVFQGLFPPIHVQTMHLSEARRIVLLNYNEQTQTIDWRHFLISVRPVGVSRRVRRVVEGSSAASGGRGVAKKIPSLASSNDIAEYLLGSRAGGEDGAGGGFETDASSASEADSDVDEEGTPRNHISLPEGYVGRGNARDTQRAVRLRELGPRMELRCVKIEEGIPGAGKEAKGAAGGNEILWHAYVKKSQAESSSQRKAVQQREQERLRRRREQEANVARKQAEKDKSKGKKPSIEDDGDVEAADREAEEQDGAAGDEDSDEQDDEFAYEDMHGGPDADLFAEDDVDVDDDDSVGAASDGEPDDDLDEEDGDEEDGDEEDGDEEESDMSPIEIPMDDGDESEEESQTVAQAKKARSGGAPRRSLPQKGGRRAASSGATRRKR